MTETNFNYTGEQNKRTNSTYIKSQQDMSSNILLQRTNYDNKTDLSNGIKINEVNLSYQDVNSVSETNIKKKVKKNDQNALNKKWMTKFFRKRE